MQWLSEVTNRCQRSLRSVNVRILWNVTTLERLVTCGNLEKLDLVTEQPLPKALLERVNALLCPRFDR